MPGQFINTGNAGNLKLTNVNNEGNLAFTRVHSELTIATNFTGGLTGFSTNGCTVAYDPQILSLYPAGNTITFQDSTTATITGNDDNFPTSLNIYWNNPISGTIFPITLSN
jgi:hypothetical protein